MEFIDEIRCLCYCLRTAGLGIVGLFLFVGDDAFEYLLYLLPLLIPKLERDPFQAR